MKVRVKSIDRRTHHVRLFELVDPDGGALPPFAAGAHVEIATPAGVARPYSLCSDPADRYRYVVAVLRESAGRGGSKAMHDRVAVGHVLDISEPRNHFALEEHGHHWRLIAGGIGATPLVAMAHRLRALGRSFDFHYCARSSDHLAFCDALAVLVEPDRLHLHVSDLAGRFEAAHWLGPARDGQHVYCCGPQPLMDAVEAATADWPDGLVHLEQFKAEPAPESSDFEIELMRSGAVVPVKRTESILVALWKANHRVPSSCEIGICGTCRVGCLGGEPDHLDTHLSPQEREREILVCVSRSRSPRLQLDL